MDASPDDASQIHETDIGHRLTRMLGVKPVQRINLLLLEGLFFYRKDNPYLFSMLHRRRSQFKEFWSRYFGMDIVVEENLAYRRLDTEGSQPDAGFKNPNIRTSGRALFHWSGHGMRERSIIFLLFLRFYQEEVRTRDEVEYGEHRFFYHEFYRRVQQSYDEWFEGNKENQPSDGTIFDGCKDVFEALERYRFIEQESTDEIEGEDARSSLGRGYKDDKVIMYRALQGLLAYDPNTLKQALVGQAYGLAEEDPEEEPIGGLEAFDTAPDGKGEQDD